MNVQVSANIYAFPGDVPSKVDGITEEINASGWSVTSFGIGGTDSFFPATVPCHWVLQRPGGAAADAEKIVRAAASKHSGALGAWSSFTSAVIAGPVSQTAKDVADVAARGGAAIEKAAGFAGFGFGATLAVAAGLYGFCLWKSAG